MLSFQSDALPLDPAAIIDALDGRQLLRLGGACTARVLGVHQEQNEHWVQIGTSAGETGDTDTVLRLSSELGLQSAIAALEAVSRPPASHPRLIDLRTHLS